MKRFAISCLCATCAVVFAACGGSSKKATPATVPPTQPAATTPQTTETASLPAAVPQACDVAPQAAAETVMGMKLLAGTPVANTDTTTCTYSGDPNGPLAQFELYIGPGAQKIYDDDHDVLQHTFTDIPGLGDESHEEEFNIFFRKGTTWVALRVTSLHEWSEFKPRAEKLANDIAGKL